MSTHSESVIFLKENESQAEEEEEPIPVPLTTEMIGLMHFSFHARASIFHQKPIVVPGLDPSAVLDFGDRNSCRPDCTSVRFMFMLPLWKLCYVAVANEGKLA